MNENRPVTFLVFGATGDLSVSKIFPALEELWEAKALHPQTRIVGLSRKRWTDKEFKEFLRDAGDRRYDKKFMERVSFSMLDVEKGEGFSTLPSLVEGEPVAFLALAPNNHEKAIAGLRDSGVLARGKGLLMIEKPFGTDEKSARALTRLITSFLEESQIKRVDHYFGKSAVAALMNLQERSSDLGSLLVRGNVSSIRIRLWEEKGIGDRAASYEGVGAFRDVGQSHMLEMLALVAVDIPENVYASGMPVPWQMLRADALATLAPPAITCDLSRRGQYQGYRIEHGVKKDSQTETAFEVTTTLYGGKLARVPVILESGKRMGKSEASIRIEFKEAEDAPKRIDIVIQPEPRIEIEHRDGSRLVKKAKQRESAYAAIIRAALSGSTREFVGSEEIQALWRYADRVVGCWGKVPLEIYGKDKPFLVQ
jgi:glucose-6-phosphate 1-dehydrogenase